MRDDDRTVIYPPHIDLIPRAWDWEVQGEAGDGTALLGKMQIGDAMFHVNAIRVEYVGDYEEQRPVKGDAELFDNLLQVYDDALETVEIPDHEGEWVLIIHPYGR